MGGAPILGFDIQAHNLAKHRASLHPTDGRAAQEVQAAASSGEPDLPDTPQADAPAPGTLRGEKSSRPVQQVSNSMRAICLLVALETEQATYQMQQLIMIPIKWTVDGGGGMHMFCQPCMVPMLNNCKHAAISFSRVLVQHSRLFLPNIPPVASRCCCPSSCCVIRARSTCIQQSLELFSKRAEAEGVSCQATNMEAIEGVTNVLAQGSWRCICCNVYSWLTSQRCIL